MFGWRITFASITFQLDLSGKSGRREGEAALACSYRTRCLLPARRIRRPRRAGSRPRRSRWPCASPEQAADRELCSVGVSEERLVLLRLVRGRTPPRVGKARPPPPPRA